MWATVRLGGAAPNRTCIGMDRPSPGAKVDIPSPSPRVHDSCDGLSTLIGSIQNRDIPGPFLETQRSAGPARQWELIIPAKTRRNRMGRGGDYISTPTLQTHEPNSTTHLTTHLSHEPLSRSIRTISTPECRARHPSSGMPGNTSVFYPHVTSESESRRPRLGLAQLCGGWNARA